MTAREKEGKNISFFLLSFFIFFLFPRDEPGTILVRGWLENIYICCGNFRKKRVFPPSILVLSDVQLSAAGFSNLNLADFLSFVSLLGPASGNKFGPASA